MFTDEVNLDKLVQQNTNHYTVRRKKHYQLDVKNTKSEWASQALWYALLVRVTWEIEAAGI